MIRKRRLEAVMAATGAGVWARDMAVL